MRCPGRSFEVRCISRTTRSASALTESGPLPPAVEGKDARTILVAPVAIGGGAGAGMLYQPAFSSAASRPARKASPTTKCWATCLKPGHLSWLQLLDAVGQAAGRLQGGAAGGEQRLLLLHLLGRCILQCRQADRTWVRMVALAGGEVRGILPVHRELSGAMKDIVASAAAESHKPRAGMMQISRR
jgi:hypothetical protein